MAEYSAEYQRILDRRDRFREDLRTALADDDLKQDRPKPFTIGMVVHDGPGIQIFDATGRPIFAELLRDPEDAAQLLHILNRI